LDNATDIAIIELLSTARTADKGINLLLDHYGSGMYGFILSYIKEEMDADDVFQEVLIKVLRKIGTYNGSSALKTWLWTVCRNESIDFLRKKNRQMKIVDPKFQTYGNPMISDSFFNGDEALRLLHAAVDHLPTVQREVFYLRYFREMSYREMAEMTGKSEGSLKTSFFQASKKVSDYLKTQA